MQDSPEQIKTEMDYFETELKYLIEGGKNFAAKYPTTASNLKLTLNGSDDPHVQQLLESFSFLAGNLQKQIDQNTQLLSRTLLENIYPNLVYPIPSMSINEFEVNSSNPSLSKGVVIPRGTILTHNSKNNVNYKFKSVFDTLLFPGDIESVKVDSSSNFDFVTDKNKKVLSIEISLFAEKINTEIVNHIRLYINAGKINSNKIYDMIFNPSTECYLVEENEKFQKIPINKITKVGFYEEESLIDIENKNPESFKVFQEYFLFPEKFLFFDINEIDYTNITNMFRFIFVFNYFQDQNYNLNKDSFKLRCTPIINLFPMVSEPIKTEKLKKTYSLYTNYLKEKFLFFHSIKKLMFLDEKNKSQEIYPITNYIFYIHEKEKYFFYEMLLNEKEPNLFEIKLYSESKHIYLDDSTIYADILVSNGMFCEKLREGNEFDTIDNYPINRGVLLSSPTKYLEVKHNSNFYWKSISYIYTEKLNFANTDEFLKDLKAIININIEVLKNNDRAFLILNSLEKAEISDKSFKIKSCNSYIFVIGKEIKLFVNSESIMHESLAIFSECLFTFLKNISNINQCLSLILIDINSKKVLYSCLPKNGTKKVL